MNRGGYITGFERGGHKALNQFLLEARDLPGRTPNAMMSLLPVGCELTENDVRHLFRNFSDAKEVRQSKKGNNNWQESIAFSMREIEIILYGLMGNKSVDACSTLIPYRQPKTLVNITKILSDFIVGFQNSDTYVRHLNNTVGFLLRLESGEDPKAAAVPRPIAPPRATARQRATRRTSRHQEEPTSASSRPTARRPPAQLLMLEDTFTKRTKSPVKGRNSVFGEAGCWNRSMLPPILTNYDTNQRPEELRPRFKEPPHPPRSCFDISDGALAFTEPKGSFTPIHRGGMIPGLDGIEDPAVLSNFLENARELNDRTPSALLNLLPAESDLDEDAARHLFRNFADTKEIRAVMFGTNNRSIRLAFSLREVEIILYACLKGVVQKEYHRLMPYRQTRGSLSALQNDLKIYCAGFENCEAYKKHLEETVGLLFRLENEKSGAASLKEDGERESSQVAQEDAPSSQGIAGTPVHPFAGTVEPLSCDQDKKLPAEEVASSDVPMPDSQDTADPSRRDHENGM